MIVITLPLPVNVIVITLPLPVNGMEHNSSIVVMMTTIYQFIKEGDVARHYCSA